MSEELERRWDDSVETAWRTFRQRLADRLAELQVDESVTIDTDPDEMAAPWCELTLTSEVLWVQMLVNGKSEIAVQLEPREVDRAAVMVVEALRETYGVLHPIYLDAEGLEPQSVMADVEPTPDLDVAVRPSSSDEVRALIDLAVADVYDEAPAWDGDGDLPMATKDCLVWVLVHKEAPRVLLSCLLVEEVTNEAAALEEVNRLNQTEFGLTFAVTEQRITVTREVGLGVAVPAAVQGEIQRLLSQVDGWARELRPLVCTAPRPDGERKGGRFDMAYAVMAELERERRGSVGPAAMVRIYVNDTGLLLKAIRITEQRRRESRSKIREARQLNQPGRAKVLQARHDYLRDLTARMRAGLRLMVDGPVRKPQVDQLALFDEDEAGTGR